MPPEAVRRSVQLLERVAMAHDRGGEETSFAAMLAMEPAGSEDALADLIEADGRYRLERGYEVRLSRYLEAAPELVDKPVALDAAIDMSLRSGSADATPDRAAAESLANAHPSLASAIWEAFELGQFVGPSSTFSSAEAGAMPLDVSRSFGPVLENGERRYSIIQQLGRGAFGTVYLAVDGLLSEADHPAMVAIKLLNKTRGSKGGSQRFLDEAARARRIRHEHVISVLDAGVSDDRRPYIIYEYVDGGDLLRWLRRHGKKTTARALAGLVAKIARGAHAAHQATVIHNDIKPSNILMTAEHEPKIADFGVAGRVAEAVDHEMDAYGAGNLAFMAPERVSGAADVQSTASDVYSLGCLLYFLLTQRLPTGESTHEIRQRLRRWEADGREERRTPVSQARDDADADLDAICERAMSIDPAERFTSAGELAQDLERWIERRPIAWLRPSLLKRTRLWARRQPVLAALSAAALVLLIGSATGAVYSVVAQARADMLQAQAEVAELRAEQAQEMADYRQAVIREGIAVIEEFLGEMKKFQEADLTEQIPLVIWVAEWIFSPRVLGHVDDWTTSWELREQVIEEFLRDARAEGDGRTVEALLWESALGFWKTKRGAGEAAIPVLESNIEHWAALVGEDDPWIDEMRVVLDVARAQALAAAPAETERGEAMILAERLEAAEESRDPVEKASPNRSLALEGLVLLYGREMLNEPEKLEAVEAQLAELREFRVSGE